MAVQKTRSLLTDTWIPEIVSVALSLLAWGMNVILLTYADQKPIFSWEGVKLNTLVSVFATISRVLLLFAVSSALGQWKFITFAQKERKMIEFQSFDEASRGVKGSLFLLWSTKLRSLAGLGALIVVLSLAIDPFSQSVIDFSTRQMQSPASPSSISRAERYSLGTHLVNAGSIMFVNGVVLYPAISTPDFSMQSSILAGVSGEGSTESSQASFQCPSSDCEWDSFQSLGVCSQCNNITSSIEEIEKFRRSYHPLVTTLDRVVPGIFVLDGPVTWFELPNGLFMDNVTLNRPPERVAMVSFGTTNWTKTVSFNGLDALVYAMSFIKIRPDVNFTASGDLSIFALEATECALYYCVNEYTSRVINGTLNETVHEVSHAQTAGSWHAINKNISKSDFTSLTQTFDLSRTDFELFGSYRMSQLAMDGIGSYIGSLMEVSFGDEVAKYLGLNTSLNDRMNGAHLVIDDSIQFEPNAIKPLYDSPDLNATFAQLANAMSNNIRSNADNGTVVYGRTGIAVYRVHWPWITLPILECVGACAFLALTIGKNRQLQVPLWKSSSLAVLACGASVDDALSGASSLSEMEAVAKQKTVSLLDVGKGEAGYASTASREEVDVELQPLSRTARVNVD